jgi:hypothetical protein
MVADETAEGEAPLIPFPWFTVQVNCVFGVVALKPIEICDPLQMVSLLTKVANATTVGFMIIVYWAGEPGQIAFPEVEAVAVSTTEIGRLVPLVRLTKEGIIAEFPEVGLKLPRPFGNGF